MRHRMRRSLVASITLALLAGVSLASAVPASKRAATTIHLDAAGFQEPDFLVPMGVVSSKNAKCVANRTVKVFFADFDGPYTQVDTARTDAKGAWAGIGHSESVGRVKAKVTESKYGPKGHRKTCEAARSRVLTIN